VLRTLSDAEPVVLSLVRNRANCDPRVLGLFRTAHASARSAEGNRLALGVG
jgi:hypothetical protein